MNEPLDKDWLDEIDLEVKFPEWLKKVKKKIENKEVL